MMGQKGSLKTGFRFQAAFYWALTVCQSAFQAASPLIFRAVRQLLPRRHFRRHFAHFALHRREAVGAQIDAFGRVVRGGEGNQRADGFSGSPLWFWFRRR